MCHNTDLQYSSENTNELLATGTAPPLAEVILAERALYKKNASLGRIQLIENCKGYEHSENELGK